MTSEEASVHIEGADPSNQYLQGCVVFLSGFENQKRVLNMRKMVMAGGGMAAKAFFRRVDYDSFWLRCSQLVVAWLVFFKHLLLLRGR